MSTNFWRKNAEHIEWYDLQPRVENVKSYYGKAEIEHLSVRLENPNDKIDYIEIYNLFSYKKNVARIIYVNQTCNPFCFGKYSNTTTRHQKEFFRQHGIDEDMLKLILKQELNEEEINKL